MNIYEVIFWGADGHDSDEDTLYLVRAIDWRSAVAMVRCNASSSDHKIHKSTLAHRVHEIGTDSSCGEQHKQILRGPYFQCAFNHGWLAWNRQFDEKTMDYTFEWEEDLPLGEQPKLLDENPMFPVLNHDSEVKSPRAENCTKCGEPYDSDKEYVCFEANTVLMDDDSFENGASNELNMISVSLWYVRDYSRFEGAKLHLFDNMKGGQGSVFFCSTKCLRGFLNSAVDALEAKPNGDLSC